MLGEHSLLMAEAEICMPPGSQVEGTGRQIIREQAEGPRSDDGLRSFPSDESWARHSPATVSERIGEDPKTLNAYAPDVHGSDDC